MNGEESGNHFAIGGDALVGLRQSFPLGVIGPLAEARGHALGLLGKSLSGKQRSRNYGSDKVAAGVPVMSVGVITH